MLSEAKKRHVVAKFRSLWSFLNSGIALLLIGAVITGVFVHSFQQRQESREWLRRNQWNRVSFRLDKMKECLGQLTHLHAHAGQAYELVAPYLASRCLESDDYEIFETEYYELQKSRIKQNAMVQSLIIHFSKPAEIEGMFEKYRYSFHRFMRDIQELMSSKSHLSRSAQCPKTDLTKSENLPKLESSFLKTMKHLIDNYDLAILVMEEDINETETNLRLFVPLQEGKI